MSNSAGWILYYYLSRCESVSFLRGHRISNFFFLFGLSKFCTSFSEISESFFVVFLLYICFFNFANRILFSNLIVKPSTRLFLLNYWNHCEQASILYKMKSTLKWPLSRLTFICILYVFCGQILISSHLIKMSMSWKSIKNLLAIYCSKNMANNYTYSLLNSFIFLFRNIQS